MGSSVFLPCVNLGDDLRLHPPKVAGPDDRHLTQVRVPSHSGVHLFDRYRLMRSSKSASHERSLSK